MLKKGEIKNLGPFSIIIPEAKNYKDDNGELHVLVSDGGMTYKEAVNNAKYNYPEWRLPNPNECSYIHSIIKMGVSGIKPTYYWIDTNIDDNDSQKFFFDTYEANITKAFKQILGAHKLGVFYIKNNW